MSSICADNGRMEIARQSPDGPDCNASPLASLLDRLADRALLTLGIFHLVFVLAFAASLVWASSALAQAPTEEELEKRIMSCSAENLVDRLRREDPGKLREALAEAEKVENGHAIFWKISGQGSEPSWLLGTMHSADPRVTKMPAGAPKRFDHASTVIIESVEAMDREKTMAAMLALKDLTLLLDGTTLDSFVPEESLDRLKSAIEARAMPWKIARHMQPWLIAATIAIPVCEVEAKNKGAPVLDTLIGTRARDEGKQLVGLETIEEQFRAVASVPREFHVSALNETLKLGTLADSMMETTKALYLEGNTALLLPLIRAYAPQTYDGKGYADFQELLIANRNRLMAERAAQYLEKGNAFMAVGALHLPGSDGLVALLRDEGFTLEPVIPPAN